MSHEETQDESASGVSRRSVLVGAAAAVAAVAAAPVVTGMGTATAATRSGAAAIDDRALTDKPNILFILCDEMRFPKVFPAGISSAAEFLETYMPNTYRLWKRGVKFSQHYSNANDCTPSRGAFVTGLYSHQSWLTTTIISGEDHASSPVLNHGFPTYGKLLRKAGYETPYIGKWHLSIQRQNPNDPDAGYLSAFGFNGHMYPDPGGANMQGTYSNAPNARSDEDIARTAIDWLSKKKASDQPWCLTVGFINPHDKEFFPAGTEFETFDNLYADPKTNPDGLKAYFTYGKMANAKVVPWVDNILKSPKDYGYADLPPNWESAEQMLANKPAYQTVARKFQALVFGGVHDSPNATDFALERYPDSPSGHQTDLGIAYAPYDYWRRSLDSYTQCMEILDLRVGEGLNSMPQDVAANTIVMFSSDHGDYSSSHGYVSGKSGSVYDEIVRVPFIVMDPSGRITGDIGKVRTGLTSHIDLLPLMVTIGNGGSRRWMKGDLGKLYGHRHDIYSMLRSSKAPGRDYVITTNDEVIIPDENFLSAPWHITGLVTPKGKLGLYSFWDNATGRLIPEGQEIEYYDYSTPGGRAEVENTSTSAQAARANKILQEQLIPHELRRPLPARYKPFAAGTHAATITFYGLVKNSAGGE